jgi:cyclic beta-1,2-glucan synthetase
MADRSRLEFFNGIGGFNASGEYEIRVAGDRLPPAPWINVVANPDGGFIVSESGSGPVWAANSSFFRLTPWENDPVSDPVGDCFYISDERSGETWTPTPAPVRGADECVIRHGKGYTVFERSHAGIASTLRVGVPTAGAVKIELLTLLNETDEPRRLTITGYVDWILGTDRERVRGHVAVETDEARCAIIASNAFEADYAHLVGFAALSEEPTALSTDRRRFLGPRGTLAAPAGLGSVKSRRGKELPDNPCAVLQAHVDLGPGQTRDIVMLVGAAAGKQEAETCIDRYRRPAAARNALDESAAAWRERLETIQVSTPEPSFDLILNGWMLYQSLASRMWGRIALYQSSGAYGFRDQLQDSMAMVYSDPALTRDQIIRAASRQFEEGDVQHWWHPDTGLGVRTRFADDLIWLAFVLNHYVAVTGDSSVLDEVTPYITTRLLQPGEDEIYDKPRTSPLSDKVYDHAVRALRRACTAGSHGLPLIGGGDWNDGMNRVGVEGRGESVWLAWFLIKTLRDFIPHARARGDNETAQDFEGIADSYREAVEETSWDGDWYRRAYYDDGSPLGSHVNEECRIDAIAQSWSVISRAGDSGRQRIAMQSFNRHLVNEDARLIRLLAPAFDRSSHDPGYIKGYLPGVRENGAQYTHAAIWSVQAEAMLGNGNRAFELFQMINPVTHALTPAAVDRYKVEPYVVAADVYTAEGHLGRGGWTWYTGSASWLYRAGLESILGFRKEGDRMFIEPRIPSRWPGYTITYRYGSSRFVIRVANPLSLEQGGSRITVDGEAVSGGIHLRDDGLDHEVMVELTA